MKFIFDLDGTVTLEETLPLIAKKFGKQGLIEELTRKTIRGDIPFVESFIKRVEILGSIPENEISDLLENVTLNDGILDFIRENSEDCIVLTGNYSGWIDGLAKKIPCKVMSSQGYYDQNGVTKITSIIKKENVVKELQASGETVIFIGDGNNDAEAMRTADVSVACGIVHYPARSVLNVADFLVIDTKALKRLLNQIKEEHCGFSVVICAAGLGSRLGLGQTKALLKIHDKTLIQYQLSQFKSVEDLRVVVGFQADQLIEHVRHERPDVIFVFNHDYFHTKTGASLYLGSKYAREFVVAWDGDLVVHHEDFQKCLIPSEYIGCSIAVSKDSVFVEVNERNQVTKFVKKMGDYEWTGPACLRKDKIKYVSGHVYSIIENYLPMEIKILRAFDIDTSEDYTRAKMIVSDWSIGNKCIDDYYRRMAEKITSPTETRNKSKDFSQFDVDLVSKYSNPTQSVLDLGSGTGLLINKVSHLFRKVTAVEKYEGFSRFINRAQNLEVVVDDLLNYTPTDQYDLVTIFGVMNFFSNEEAIEIYRRANTALNQDGLLIVKNQMGILEDVIVNGFSSELDAEYYSHYRTVANETALLNRAGFKVLDCVDIYPPEFNRWPNTHFYALVCDKIQL